MVNIGSVPFNLFGEYIREVREFNKLDPSTQSDIIDSIYTYAKEMAKIDYAKKKGLNVWKSDSEKKSFLREHPDAKGFVQKSDVAKIDAASKAGISIGEYYTIKALVDGMKKYEKRAKLSELGVPYSVQDIF